VGPGGSDAAAVNRPDGADPVAADGGMTGAAAAGPTAPRAGAVTSTTGGSALPADVGAEITAVGCWDGTLDRTAAGVGAGVELLVGVPSTATVTSPAMVNTVASATHRRRQYTAAGSGPTGSHIHS
jgi:hypothetical protein